MNSKDYDPETCMTAAELRQAGWSIPDDIPDTAWIPKTSLSPNPHHCLVSYNDETRQARFEVSAVLTEPFRWIQAVYEEELLSEKDLAEIENRALLATDAPWHVRDYGGLHVVGPSGHGGMIANFSTNSDEGWEGRQADAFFIAHARDDVVRLVAEVRRLRKLVEEQ